MKKILLSMLLMITACAEQSKTIKVGLNAEYPPYEYMEGDSYAGFNVEVVSDTMKTAGLDFEFVNMTFDGLLAALQSKKVDVVLGVSPTPARREMVDYTISYTKGDPQVLLVHKDSLNVVTSENLSDKSVGALLGSFQETILNALGGVDVRAYNNYTGALLDLNNKKIDAILVSKNPSKEYLAQNPNLVVGGYVEESINDGYAIALNKGDDALKAKLDKAIQQLLDEGVVEGHIEKYKINE